MNSKLAFWIVVPAVAFGIFVPMIVVIWTLMFSALGLCS